MITFLLIVVAVETFFVAALLLECWERWDNCRLFRDELYSATHYGQRRDSSGRFMKRDNG